MKRAYGLSSSFRLRKISASGSRLLVLITLIAACSAEQLLLAGEVSIKLPQSRYRPGENVVAVIEASKNVAVAVESDLAIRAFTVSVIGKRKVSLGRIVRPGFYVARVRAGTASDLAVFVVLPDKPNYSVVPLRLPDKKRFGGNEDAFTKFARQLTLARLRAALEKAFPDWATQNAAKIGKGFTMACVCVAGVPIACGETGKDALELGTSLVVAVLQQAARDMQADSLLTPKQANQIVRNLTIGNAVLEILAAQGTLDRLFVLVNTWAELSMQSNGVKATVKYATDVTGKVQFLVKLNK